jgi:hypothetical protein
MAICEGKSEDHCCYVSGEACKYLLKNAVEGRRWACGLYHELGSWKKVHVDPRYLKNVKPRWKTLGIVDCGDWPGPGERCNECGVIGDG